MGTVVDADGVAIDELAPEPAGDGSEATPAKDKPKASASGAVGSSRRSNQLATKSTRSTTLPTPWRERRPSWPRVPLGMAVQSMSPGTAAMRPPMIPAAIIQ